MKKNSEFLNENGWTSTKSFRSFSTKQYYDICIKLLLLGDSNVGKSSLLMRFSEGTFSPDLRGNAGIDVKTKYIDIQNKKIKLELWDTAGHERFRTISSKYYKGAMGIILVYDVSERNSFENVEEWISQINEETTAGEIEILLVGNKIDLERSVQKEEGEFLSKKYKIPFIETSAKEANNVEESFIQIASSILKNDKILEKFQNEKLVSVQINNKGSQTKKNCC